MYTTLASRKYQIGHVGVTPFSSSYTADRASILVDPSVCAGKIQDTRVGSVEAYHMVDHRVCLVSVVRLAVGTYYLSRQHTIQTQIDTLGN